MRALRIKLAVAALLGTGLAPRPADAQTPAQIEDLLRKLHPTQQGVEYDTPTDKAAIAACKMEKVFDKDKKAIGWAIRDGQGQLIRKFLDTNGLKDAKGEPHSDQWSYYKDGFEVYREVDLDDDQRLDECRWLNTGGTRVAVLKDGKIAGWKRLSAEEASKVLVQAIITGDAALLESVMAAPEELAKLGVPKSQVEAATKAKADRKTKLSALVKTLGASGWNKTTTWGRFDGQMPHVIPADAGEGLAGDLVLYENATIFTNITATSAKGGALNVAYLQVPEIVRIGEVWKFVDLPQAVDPEKPQPPAPAQVALRSAIFGEAGAIGGEPGNEALDTALKALAEYETKNAPPADADAKAVAQFHLGRIRLLQPVVEAAKNPDEQLTYNKERINSLAAAYQTGQYPDGGKALDKIVAAGGKVGTYADYRKIFAEYAMEESGTTSGTELLALQKKFVARLAKFVADHPEADEVPEALFQAGSGSEFNADEKEARSYYERLAKDYASTPAGKKAAGALRRLDLEGKPIAMAGAGIDGKTYDTRQYKGKTLLIVFWSSREPQFKDDAAKFEKLAQKLQGKNFAILGVNLDDDKAEMEAFLKDNPLPWPMIHEEGGMYSRLADEYGILTLPLMFLVDPQGQVVSRGLRSPEDVERALDKAVVNKPAGVKLGVKDRD